MPDILQMHFDLALYTTFGVNAKARFFAAIESVEDLEAVLSWYRDQEGLPLLILGGGSNILFTEDFEGLVISLNTKGKRVLHEDEDELHLQVEAGVDWHELVMWTVDQEYYGLENLALIPGKVGAAPIQNIGAYGREIKDVFVELEALNIETGKHEIFTHQECRFGYRDSIFKKERKGQWIILRVTFLLHKKGLLNTEYRALKEALEAKDIVAPSIADVAQTVIAVRQSKLPDPKMIGSGGSFFKNPVITQEHADRLVASHQGMPHYVLGDGQHKVPAAWLIEFCGWKGKRFGKYGVHEDQPLVLVNYGGASGKDIAQLSRDIAESVEAEFGIKLEAEVNIL